MDAGTFQEKESVFITTPSVPDDPQQASSNPSTEVQKLTIQNLSRNATADDDFIDKRRSNAEPGSTEVNLDSAETEDFGDDLKEDFPDCPLKEDKMSTIRAAKKEIPSTKLPDTAEVSDNVSDNTNCIESTSPALLLKSSDDSSSSAAKNKKTMMESMGLTEKHKETESTSMIRRTRGSFGMNNGNQETVDTPSPGRKTRSSRNCSTPVWLDLIPKRNKKIKIEANETNIKDRKALGSEMVVTGPQSVLQEENVKSCCRQSIKRKSTAGDGEEATKRSRQSLASNTLTDNKEETPSGTQASKKLMSKSKEASPSESPRQQRLSKRLTVKAEEEPISSETPRRRGLSKSSLKSEEDCSPEKQDQMSDRSNSGSDEESSLMISHNQPSKMVTRGSEKKTSGRFVSLKGKASKKKKSAASMVIESKCDVCGKKYSTPQNMRRHRITHSDFKAYKCTFCSQRFHYIQYLREHVVGCLNNPQRVKYRNHDRMRPSPVMMKHLKIVPSPDEPGTYINLPYSKISDKLSEVNAQEEIKNLTAENTEEEILEVLNKVKASQPEVNLQEARRRHRNATKEFRLGVNSKDWMTDDGQYKCNVCDKIILNQYNLYRHLQTHNESKRYKCTYCGRRFTLGQYLKDHVISCKNNKNRITNSTNRRFIDRDLKRNVIILPSTVEEGTFVNAEIGDNLDGTDVEHDPDNLSAESDLVKNGESLDGNQGEKDDDATAKTNTGEVYKCSLKEWNNYYAHRSYDGTGRRAFTLSSELIRVFKKERELGDERLKNKVLTPYHCTVCNLKKFNRAETLRRHLFVHMDNNHMCKICGMTFRCQDYLKAHVLQQHFAIKRKRKSRAIKRFTTQLKSTGSMSSDKFCGDIHESPPKESQSENKTPSSDDKAHCSDDIIYTSSDKAHKSDDKIHDSDDKPHSSGDKENSDEQYVNSEEKPYMCDNCRSAFKLESLLNVHKLVCPQKPGTQKNKLLRRRNSRECVTQLHNFQKRILFQCVECKNKFFKHENLLWHQYNTHGLASFTKCPVCSVNTDDGSLLTHMVQHHPKYQVQPKADKLTPPVYNYKCNQCDKTFTKELTMLIHQQKHMPNKQFDPEKGNQCPVCHVNFTTFGNMRRHFKVIHSDEKPFMCHLCGKSFKTNDTLKCHVKIHDREKYLNFKCKTCGKGFFRSRLLKEHETLHIPGATTCMCDICGKRFRLKPNLSKHMNSVHNKERNHACATCGKTFKLKEQLKNHMRYHVIKEGKVGEVGNMYGKIYKCETCGKFCPSSYALKIHKTSHSSERPYTCELCGRSFKVKSKIQRHIRTVHNVTGKTRRPRKQVQSKKAVTQTCVKKENAWSAQDESNVAESIVEVIVNSEAELVQENTKMYSLLDHSYRPSSSTATATATATATHFSHNDPSVIEEAVQGITQLAGDSAETDYIIQGVQEVEDQPGMYIVSSDVADEEGSESQTFSLSVDEGPKTLIYYITTD